MDRLSDALWGQPQDTCPHDPGDGHAADVVAGQLQRTLAPNPGLGILREGGEAERMVPCHMEDEVATQRGRPTPVLGLRHVYPGLFPSADDTPQPQHPGRQVRVQRARSRQVPTGHGRLHLTRLLARAPVQLAILPSTREQARHQHPDDQPQVAHHQPTLAVPQEPVQATLFRLPPQSRPKHATALPQPQPPRHQPHPRRPQLPAEFPQSPQQQAPQQRNMPGLGQMHPAGPPRVGVTSPQPSTPPVPPASWSDHHHRRRTGEPAGLTVRHPAQQGQAEDAQNDQQMQTSLDEQSRVLWYTAWEPTSAKQDKTMRCIVPHGVHCTPFRRLAQLIMGRRGSLFQPFYGA